MLLLLGLLLFILLIVVHEYGHFLVAKRNGVEVEEFGIGFPPRVAGKKMGKGIFESYYSINWLPLGGFVRLKGENDADKRKGSFGAASLWAKTKITMAGVVMNFIAAVVIFTGLSFTGVPVILDNQVSYGDSAIERTSAVKVGFIEEGSPAEQADIRLEDDLVSFNNEPILEEARLYELTEENAGEVVTFELSRNGELLREDVQLNSADSEQGFLGVIPYQIRYQEYSGIDTVLNGVALSGQFAWETLRGLSGTVADLFSGEVSEAGENVSGPVGIFVILRNINSLDIMLMFIGLISVTLAIMNSLPIPALDGGRLAVMYLFRLFNKKLTAEREQAIHGTGMAVLLLLIALITIVDVNRIF